MATSAGDAKKPKGKSVQLCTFIGWSLNSDILYETETANGRETVIQVTCKLCKKHLDQIQGNAQIRGQIKKEIEVFARGTNNVKKHAIHRHLESTGHKIAQDLEQLLDDVVTVATGDAPTSQIGDDQSESAPKHRQPRIDTVITKLSRDAYYKLFKTAYQIAIDGLPLRTFTAMVKIQKENGVALISGCDSQQRAKQFIHFLAEEERAMLHDLITEQSCFSVLNDGSQARKTGSEKELVYVRILHDGKPVYYCVSLKDMDEYGAANAENLKKAIDDTFLETLKLTEEQYTNMLVCAVADGASVNTGAFSGLLHRLEEERQWLVKIHCVNHRVELGVKDSLLNTKENKLFTEIQQFLISLYYLFKKSPKVSRHFYTTASIHEAQVYKAKKVHGTRFINHQKVGLETLMSDWLILIIAFENTIAAGKNSTAKLPGLLLKLRNFRFLIICCYFLKVLSVITPMSLKFERGDIMAHEVLYEVEKVTTKLDDMQEDAVKIDELLSSVNMEYVAIEPSDSDSDAGETELSSEPTVKCKLVQKAIKKGHKKRKVANQQYTKIEYERMTNTSADGAISAVKTIQTKVLPKISKCLTERFSSFQDDVYKSMQWLDPANWSEDDIMAEVPDIINMAKLFAARDGAYKIEYDDVVIKREWKNLRSVVRHFYRRYKCKALWRNIIRYRKKDFPNLCLLAEIGFCVGPSNSTVECGFSHLTSMLSDRRLSTSHETMEDCLMLKINHLVFQNSEREEVISKAVDKFLLTRRKRKMEDPIGTSTMSAASSGSDSESNEDVVQGDGDDDADLSSEYTSSDCEYDVSDNGIDCDL